MAQQVSSYTTLDRTVAQIKRDIEKADPSAEVQALDFRSSTIAKRNPGSAGTHSMQGRSDEGYIVRGAADVNVYKKGTRTPHPNEWALLNKYGKPLAIRYGLAYTFPNGPKVYLRSHSGASLHLHIDVSVWGTDYGDCYSPYRAGKGGYYRQKHAGNPKAKPPKIGSSATPAKPNGKPAKLTVDGKIGLKATDAIQYLAGTPRDKKITGQPRSIRGSVGRTLDTCWPTLGYGKGGSKAIAWLQRQAGVKGDGLLGPASRKAVQRMVGAKPDGNPGPDTCRRLQQWINKKLGY